MSKTIELRESQESVYKLIQRKGPLTDQRLSRLYKVKPSQSDSGLRTRRSELVDLGLVRDSGERARLESGRSAILWEAV